MAQFEQWRAGILTFEAARDYENPFLDVSIWAVFTGPNGETVKREAYWDGGRTYRVSFAPTSVGRWSYTLNAPEDSGLNGVSGEVESVPYAGELAIYKHGFLKVADNKRFLCYADGTPFFWLGDTHWGFVAGEKWDESNHPEMSSMFKGMVDRRVSQHYTVYQTNLRSEPQMGTTHYWADGQIGTLPDVSFYQQKVDKRMQYLADQGLVNALGLAWAGSVIGQLDLQKNLARYIVARYGALPIVWTLAGEVAGYAASTREACIDGWREVAKYIAEIDGYNTLQTAHYTNERPYADYYFDEDWFDFTLNQGGHGDLPIYAYYQREHMKKHPGKPFVEGEEMYEFVSTLEPNGSRLCTADMMRRCAYLSIQNGACGYTYGAQGIWDTVWEKPKKPDSRNIFNRLGITWYEAIDGEGAAQLGLMRDFYEEAGVSDMHPDYDCFATEGVFADPLIAELYVPHILSTDDRSRMILYYLPTARGEAPLKGLSDGSYHAEWFDPRTGEKTVYGDFTPEKGCWTAPVRPGDGDWILYLKQN